MGLITIEGRHLFSRGCHFSPCSAAWGRGSIFLYQRNPTVQLLKELHSSPSFMRAAYARAHKKSHVNPCSYCTVHNQIPRITTAITHPHTPHNPAAPPPTSQRYRHFRPPPTCLRRPLPFPTVFGGSRGGTSGSPQVPKPYFCGARRESPRPQIVSSWGLNGPGPA